MAGETVIKWIIGGLAALGGLAIGALARQPEVSSYKKQIITLKKDLSERMLKVEEELNRQVDELNKRYMALKAWQFFEKAKAKSIYEKKAREVFFMKCCCSEYIRILGKSLSKDMFLNEQETQFLKSFDNVLNNKLEENDLNFVKVYISNKNFDIGTSFNFQAQIEHDIVA